MNEIDVCSMNTMRGSGNPHFLSNRTLGVARTIVVKINKAFEVNPVHVVFPSTAYLFLTLDLNIKRPYRPAYLNSMSQSYASTQDHGVSEASARRSCDHF